MYSYDRTAGLTHGILYHCGRKGLSKLDWLQTAQEIGTIGPGVYLTPDKEWLLKSNFCRRSGNSLYTVEAKLQGVLPAHKPLESAPQIEGLPVLQALYEKREKKTGRRPNWDIAAALEALVQELGGQAFVRTMKSLKVSGTWGRFADLTEFAIFDSSVLKITDEAQSNS